MTQIINVNGTDIRVTGKMLRVARPDADGYACLKDPEEVIKGLRSSSNRVDLFTFLELWPATSAKYPYSFETDNAAVIPVTTFDSWWKQIRPEARNRARQAEKKGIVLRETPFDENLVKGIWEIYNETPFRQGRRFPHFGKDMETVRGEAATYLDSSFFIGAFVGDKLAGFVKLTMDESKTRANLMNILSLVEHRDKAPTNALIAHSVRACAERGITHLVYQRYAYGTKPTDGIQKFKQVNGFQRVDLPRYYVPLTTAGHIAYRLRLHQPLSEHLPQAMSDKLRELRNSWYARKFQTVKESA